MWENSQESFVSAYLANLQAEEIPKLIRIES